MKADKRVAAFEWWHEAVFGPKPKKAAIPFQVLRDYLNWEREAARHHRLHEGFDAQRVVKR